MLYISIGLSINSLSRFFSEFHKNKLHRWKTITKFVPFENVENRIKQFDKSNQASKQIKI